MASRKAEVVPPEALDPLGVGRPVAEDPIGRDFSRFALNALLVPLLDDAEPPRWTDAALAFSCGPATRVQVDGRPLVAGATIPARAFEVRWTMDGCTQIEAFELAGVVELLVFHEDSGLSAVVDARRSTLTSGAETRRLAAPFTATMALAAAPDPRLRSTAP